MISLRTREGIDLDLIQQLFGEKYLSHCIDNAQTFIQSNKLVHIQNKLKLSTEGIQTSNIIISELLAV